MNPMPACLVVLLSLLAAVQALASPALEEAIRSCDLAAAREAIASSPGTTEVDRLWNSARVDLIGGRTAPAVEKLGRLVEKESESSVFRLWYSRALFAQASEASAFRRLFIARRAISELRESLELDPENDEAAIDLILIHLRVPVLGGGMDEARKLANAMSRRDSPFAPMARGILAWEDEEWEKALGEFEAAAASVGDPRRALFWIGYVHQKLGQWDEAFAIHEVLLGLSPHDPRVWYEFARTAQFSGLRTRSGPDDAAAATSERRLPSGARSKDEARELLGELSP